MDRILLFAQSKAGIVIMALVALLVLERLFPVARALGGLRGLPAIFPSPASTPSSPSSW